MTKESPKLSKGFLGMWLFGRKSGESKKVRIASRLFGKAVRLREKEKPYEAIVMVCRALRTVRESGANLIGSDALNLIMSATSLFDELATKVGRPEIVLTALKEAVELCDRAVMADSNLMAAIQPYRDRFYHRISLIAAQQKVSGRK